MNILKWHDSIDDGNIKNCILWMKKYNIKPIKVLPETKDFKDSIILYIYRIINVNNGKSYIGQTKRSLTKRWNEHLFYDKCSQFHKDLHNFPLSDFAFKVEEMFIMPKSTDPKLDFIIMHFLRIRELNYIFNFGDCNCYNEINIT